MASHRSQLPLILLLGLSSASCANAPVAPEPKATGLQEQREIKVPASNQRDTQPAATAEASHQAGAFLDSDIVVVIDRSTVSLLASGIDVDGDGIVGSNRSWATERDWLPQPAWKWTTDPGDTIDALQLMVARALVERLAARQNRVGLVSQTLRARTEGTTLVRLIDKPAFLVPVGSPDAVLAVLADFPTARERRRTDLARLLEVASQLLDEAEPDVEPARPGAILLLSLGQPSAPDGIHWSSQRALAFAKELGTGGTEVWAVPFGTPDVGFLNELTRMSGGRVVPLDELDARFPASGGSSLQPGQSENITMGR